MLIKEIRQGILLRDPTFVGFASVEIYRVLFFWLGYKTRVSVNSGLPETIKFITNSILLNPNLSNTT